MPTNTFFRLPEEKRERLLEACWAECTRTRLSGVSINRIITQAHIPRGSFYQYFEDKEDMCAYLLGDMQQYFVQSLRDVLEEVKGDLLGLPLGAFDRFVRRKGDLDPVLARFIQIIRLNHGMDMHAFLAGHPGPIPDALWEKVDASKLRQSDREFAEHVFYLCCAVLACAMAETLHRPERWQEQRKKLEIRMEMLRCGCAAGGQEKEETP